MCKTTKAKFDCPACGSKAAISVVEYRDQSVAYCQSCQDNIVLPYREENIINTVDETLKRISDVRSHNRRPITQAQLRTPSRGADDLKYRRCEWCNDKKPKNVQVLTVELDVNKSDFYEALSQCNACETRSYISVAEPVDPSDPIKDVECMIKSKRRKGGKYYQTTHSFNVRDAFSNNVVGGDFSLFMGNGESLYGGHRECKDAIRVLMSLKNELKIKVYDEDLQKHRLLSLDEHLKYSRTGKFPTVFEEPTTMGVPSESITALREKYALLQDKEYVAAKLNNMVDDYNNPSIFDRIKSWFK
jgi:transcription elongation factor Elf1